MTATSAVLAGCAPSTAQPPLSGVLSTDYCADQMLLALVPARGIAGVSPDADADRWFAAPRAQGIARVRPSFEAIMARRPAIVLRAYGGDAGLVERLRGAGVRVIAVPSAMTLGAAADDLRRVGDSLGRRRVAEARLAASGLNGGVVAPGPTITTPTTTTTALYLTPGNVTTGPDGFVADVLRHGGVTTFRRQPGWGPVPIERLTIDPPALVVRAFFEDPRASQDRWSVTRHPVLARAIARAPTIDVPGAWLACGNWLGGHAARAIRAGAS